MLRELRALLAACPPAAEPADYVQAVLDSNVLAKRSESTRKRSLRYLRELYVLDRRSVLFRGLRDLWDADSEAQRLLALLCALARDPLLRATADIVLDTSPGNPVGAAMLAAAVAERFPSSFERRWTRSSATVTARETAAAPVLDDAFEAAEGLRESVFPTGDPRRCGQGRIAGRQRWRTR
jgi:hypothetical protein